MIGSRTQNLYRANHGVGRSAWMERSKVDCPVEKFERLGPHLWPWRSSHSHAQSVEGTAHRVVARRIVAPMTGAVHPEPERTPTLVGELEKIQ